MSTARVPNTPGFGGYLLALGIGGLVFGLAWQVTGLEPGIWMPLAALWGVFFFSLFTVGLPILVLVALAIVVHLTVRSWRDQRLHVLAAFVVPLVGLYPLWLMTHFAPEVAVAMLALPVSMSVGRAAVIPLVTRRREAVFAGKPRDRGPAS